MWQGMQCGEASRRRSSPRCGAASSSGVGKVPTFAAGSSSCGFETCSKYSATLGSATVHIMHASPSHRSARLHLPPQPNPNQTLPDHNKHKRQPQPYHRSRQPSPAPKRPARRGSTPSATATMTSTSTRTYTLWTATSTFSYDSSGTQAKWRTSGKKAQSNRGGHWTGQNVHQPFPSILLHQGRQPLEAKPAPR